SASGVATKTGTPATTADPLRSLPLPNPAGLPSYGAVSIYSGSPTLQPGVYQSILAAGKPGVTVNVTMSPGLYIIEGGGLSISTGASLSGSGVTLFNAGSLYNGTTDGGTFGSIATSGSGTIALSAPSSGPYAGVVLFQSLANPRGLSLGGNT